MKYHWILLVYWFSYWTRFNRACVAIIWEFLFCTGPDMTPTKSKSTCPFIWKTYDWACRLWFSGGRGHVDVGDCDFSIGSWDGGWWKWCETPMKWLYPGKIVDFSSRKIDKNMKNGLKWVVRRAFRDLIFLLSRIFWDESYGVAIMGSNLVKKIILKGSAGQKNPKKNPNFGGVFKLETPK